jgi:hypothetical protein
MQSVVMLNVNMLSVVMLSVVAPFYGLPSNKGLITSTSGINLTKNTVNAAVS